MKWKKVIAALLAFTLAFGVLPGTVFAVSLPENSLSIEDGQEYEITDTYTISAGKTLSVYGGSLTIKGTLKIEAGGTLELMGGSVTVENEGCIELQTFAASIIDWEWGGQLLFKQGSKATYAQEIADEEFPTKYLDGGCKATKQEDNKTYLVEGSDDIAAVKQYALNEIKNLLKEFSGLTASGIFDTARAELTKITRASSGYTKQNVDAITTAAKRHLSPLRNIITALNDAKDRSDQLVEKYTTQYPEYVKPADDMPEGITGKALDEAKTAAFQEKDNFLSKTYATYYTVANYSDDPTPNVVETARNDATAAYNAVEEAVNGALAKNAGGIITNFINGLKDNSTYYPDKIEALASKAAELIRDTPPKVTGTEAVAQLEVIKAQASAVNELRMSYGEVAQNSPDIKTRLESHMLTVQNMTSTSGVEYALGQAKGDLQPRVDGYNNTEVKTAREDALKKFGESASFSAYARDKSNDWTSRTKQLSDTCVEETLNGLVKNADVSAIKNATTKEAVEAALKAVEADVDLKIEKQICKWELEAAKTDAEKLGKELDTDGYKAKLQSIFDQYSKNIEGATNETGAQRERDYGISALNEAQAFEEAKTGAVTNITGFLSKKFNTRVGEGKLYNGWPALYIAVQKKYTNLTTEQLMALFEDATTSAQINSIIATAQTNLWLAAEKVYANQQIDTKVSGHDLGRDDAKTELGTLVDRWKGYIDDSPTPNDVTKNASEALVAIDEQIKKDEAANALAEAKTDAFEGLLEYASELYNGYFDDVELFNNSKSDPKQDVNTYLSSLEAKHNVLKGVLETWKGNIDKAPDTTTIEQVYAPNAQSAVNEQFIVEVRVDACNKLNEYSNADGTVYVTDKQNAQNGLGVQRSIVSKQQLVDSLKPAINSAGSVYGNDKAKANAAKDAVLKALDEAKANLDGWRGVTLTVKKQHKDTNSELDTTKLYLINSVASCTAADTFKDSSFAYWDFDGSHIPSKTLSVKMTGDRTVTAVYGEATPEKPEEPQEPIVISDITLNNGYLLVKTTRNFTSGDVQAHGILYTTRTDLIANTLEGILTASNYTDSQITVNDVQVRNHCVNDDTEIGSTEFKIQVSKNGTSNVRMMAYAVVKYRDGIRIVFSNQATYSGT